MHFDSKATERANVTVTAPTTGTRSTTTIRPGDGGRLIVRKTAASPEDLARLEREADVVSRLPPAGVPRLGSWDRSIGRLDLEHAGDHTLDTAPALGIDEITRLLAALAATLAAVHGRGISHGRLDTSHVVLAADGTPVLVGWGAAGTVPLESGSSSTSPAPFDPNGDVAALGRLAQHLLQSVAGGARAGSRARTRVAAVAAAAAHPDVTLRPSLDDIVRILTIEATAPPASPRRPMPSLAHLWRTWRQRVPSMPSMPSMPVRGAAVFLGAVAVAAATTITILVAPWRAGPSGSSPPALGATASTPAPSASIPPPPTSTTVATTDTVPLPCPTDATQAAALGLEVRCLDGVAVEGRRVSLGEETVELGVDGDLVALADLTCDGFVDAVLLRTGTGEIYVFDGWARPGEPLTGRLTDRVADAVGIATPETTGCPTAVLTLADGSTVELRTETPS